VEETDDVLAAEGPLEIAVVSGPAHSRSVKVVSVTMRTPGSDIALSVGYLMAEGAISGARDVLSATEAPGVVTLELAPHVQPQWETLDRRSATTSSCGACGKTSAAAALGTTAAVTDWAGVAVRGSFLQSLPDRLRSTQAAFASTGGVHASAVFALDGALLGAAEDVGRHNALDKLVGRASLDGALPFGPAVLVLSGRASHELVQKATMADIGFIAAIGAPSSLAVDLAVRCGITLVGFLRPTSFNVYSHSHRIDFDY
jgi:FdhD protein